MDLDLIVIDGGTAGINAAKEAHKLGAELAHAENIVQIAAVAVRGGLKKSEVGAMHYVFPTIGGAILDTVAL
jgi:pyruvate/2-oxoglutarate dehydrogenase complex dihydrolipoamide dehydrogenase (E3) component